MRSQGKFRKKPITIKAFRMTEERKNRVEQWPDWLQKAWGKNAVFLNDRGGMVIKTLEGPHQVIWGDYIIQGVEGELYPCKPQIFEATYEEA